MSLFENYPQYMERLLETITRKMELTQVHVLDSEEKDGEEVVTISAKYKTVIRTITIKCFDTFSSVYVAYSQYDLLVALVHNLESTAGKHYFHWETADLKIKRNTAPEVVENYEKSAGKSFAILVAEDVLNLVPEEEAEGIK